MNNFKNEIVLKIKKLSMKAKRQLSMSLRFTATEKAIFEYLSFLDGKNQSDLIREAFQLYFEKRKKDIEEE